MYLSHTLGFVMLKFLNLFFDASQKKLAKVGPRGDLIVIQEEILLSALLIIVHKRYL